MKHLSQIKYIIMKKIFLLPIIYCLLIIGCQTNEPDILANEEKATLQQKNEREEAIPLIRKVAATFNKVVQNEEVWKQIQDFVTEDHVILKSDYVFEDHFIMRAETIKDDLIMGLVSFENRFIETYKTLYPEENINYNIILESLPKLHFGIPVSALENYNIWKEKGFPVTVKSYNIKNNQLKKLTREETIKSIGLENFNKLINKNQQESEYYYYLKNEEITSVIAPKGKKGSVVLIKNNNTSLASFSIDDKKDHNVFTINDGQETYSVSQNNMMYQTYIDLPNGCNDYYTFICGSEDMNQYYTQMQNIANETCETIWRCIPCCNPYTGNVTYLTTIFEPSSLKCKKTLNYLNVLSMYPLTPTNT